MNHHKTLMKNDGPPAFNAVRGEGVSLDDDLRSVAQFSVNSFPV